MNHFELSGGELACEDVPLSAIAEAVGTPVYVYSSATLVRHFTVLREALTADEVKARIAGEGAEPLPGTPADYARDIDAEEKKWRQVVKDAAVPPAN